MDNRAAGITIIVFVAIIFLVIIQNQKYAVNTTENIITDITKAAGVTIETYVTPEFFTPEQKLMLEKYASNGLNNDPLPGNYQTLAQQQAGQTVLANGTAVNATEKILPLYVSSAGSSITYVRGDEIPIVGKITLDNKPAPYWYNVIITCCGMTAFQSRSYVETDGQGNFGFMVRPDSSFPLGDWVVTIMIIGDDNKYVKHDFTFRLNP